VRCEDRILSDHALRKCEIPSLESNTPLYFRGSVIVISLHGAASTSQLCQAHITTPLIEDDHQLIRRGQSQQQPQGGEPLCWCDLNVPTSTFSQCPLYPLGSIQLKPGLADFFASLELKNPAYIDLQLCAPDLSSSDGYTQLQSECSQVVKSKIIKD
jgi:hypothetical protein